jgi:hypothetical protein
MRREKSGKDGKREVRIMLEMGLRFCCCLYQDSDGTMHELVDRYGVSKMPLVVAFTRKEVFFGSEAVIKVPCDDPYYFYDLLNASLISPRTTEFVSYQKRHPSNEIQMTEDEESFAFMVRQKGKALWLPVDALLAIMLNGIRGLVQEKIMKECNYMIISLPEEYTDLRVIACFQRAATRAHIDEIVVGTTTDEK